ncbi:beta-galactosidase [Propioniciclava coleopterorum]|uniref:beta-galactosidase n=1 Tax=Propioniciclava coleopterorum TaxID=2714937 RepID=A0A6G7Y5H3_9ACTN|nr:glycoside hydrolase family 2 TIM barrel-domain containing protein [Propioniciclava coleopterorum]QIK71867.1 beta-galactosidase [Propioniciclava coleopterorum]
MTDTTTAPAKGDFAAASGTICPPRSHLASDARRLDLAGTWDFTLTTSGRSVTGTMPVPAHWVLQDDGRWGSPAYTNVSYPFPLDPPHVPDANPTGHYRRTVTLPADWPTGGSNRLRLLGVESEATVTLNGAVLGLTRGSRLTREFDLGDALRPGDNVLEITVRQWSPGSYLEDQDQWWLPGIFRDVELLHRPDGGLEDVWLRADFDPATGEGLLAPEFAGAPAWPVTLSCPELGLQVAWDGPDDVAPLAVPGGEPWSAETPRLYDVTVGNAAETVALRVGFRRSAIVDGVWQVNGRPVTLPGVNRHETHPRRGRVFDEEAARADLALMKAYNVNTIRTSHYPPHPRLLDLCDEVGLYVMLENDYETHGFEHIGWEGNPSSDPRWRDALLDRMRRTVERDKNHASVIAWSLGNEAHTGPNLAAAAAWTRDRDPSRPIHYEGDHEAAYTDVYSRMYPTVEEVALVLEHDAGPVASPTHEASRASAEDAARIRTQPYFLCEYVHAMGTGPGGIEGYVDAMAHPRHAGGCVWEWRDHALERLLPDGTRAFAYGGDFGEAVHDGNFVCDGLVNAVSRPGAGLVAWANLVAPVVASVDAAGVAEVRSRLAHADIADGLLRWECVGADRTLTGDVPLPRLAPGASVTVSLGIDPDALAAADAVTVAVLDPRTPGIAPREPREIDPATGEPRLPAVGEQTDAGRVVHVAQWVRPNDPGTTPETPAGAREATPDTPAGASGATPGTADGPAGADAGAEPPAWVRALRPVVFRAPTDNDRGHRPSDADRWADARLDLLEHRVVGRNATGITLRSGVPDAARRIDTHLTWAATPDGVRVRATMVPSGDWPTLPRLGLTVDLGPAWAEAAVRWYGLGPTENYPDLAGGVRVGTFAAPGIDDLWAPEIRPQEAGHRGGLRRLTLEGAGRLEVEIDPHAEGRRPGFSLARWTPQQLAAAPHAEDLPDPSGVWLTLDARHAGIGTASCGPATDPQFRVAAEPVTLTFTVRG